MNVRRPTSGRRGSVLILVLWIAFGLVVLAIYFANSMSLELRAAQNRVATITAEHATTGAATELPVVHATLGIKGMRAQVHVGQQVDVVGAR